VWRAGVIGKVSPRIFLNRAPLGVNPALAISIHALSRTKLSPYRRSEKNAKVSRYHNGLRYSSGKSTGGTGAEPRG